MTTAIAEGVPALLCTGLVHVYRVLGTDVAALRGIDLRVPAGQRVALLGPSGSGKSTLLSVAAGIMRPSAGTVEVFGVDLGAATPRRLRQVRSDSLGLMLQGAATNLLLYDTPRGNLDFALQGAHRRDREIAEAALRAGGLDASPAAGRATRLGGAADRRSRSRHVDRSAIAPRR